MVITAKKCCCETQTLGACCPPDGNCINAVTEQQCDALGGVWLQGALCPILDCGMCPSHNGANQACPFTLSVTLSGFSDAVCEGPVPSCIDPFPIPQPFGAVLTREDLPGQAARWSTAISTDPQFQQVQMDCKHCSGSWFTSWCLVASIFCIPGFGWQLSINMQRELRFDDGQITCAGTGDPANGLCGIGTNQCVLQIFYSKPAVSPPAVDLCPQGLYINPTSVQGFDTFPDTIAVT